VSTVIAPTPPNDGREWDCMCARCGSSVTHVDCDQCGGDGLDGHECGEDSCCCEFPDENRICDVCCGAGSWLICMSSLAFCLDNPKPGREAVERGTVEWFPA